jgi:hypothetical protein
LDNSLVPSSPRREDSFVTTRETALTVDCDTLYYNAIRKAGTLDVTITIQPGREIEGEWVGGKVLVVPQDSNVSLGSLISDAYSHCKVTVSYAPVLALSGDDKVSRDTFLIQTLDIWERWANRLVSVHVEGKRRDIENAIELLKKTYSFEELLPANASVSYFKAYFNLPTKEESLG